MQKSSEKNNEAASRHPEKILTGEPFIPSYNGSKFLPVARLLHDERTAGVTEELGEEGESSYGLLDEITAPPPHFECNHGEDLEDDPQLTLGNMKKFQANVREFTKFSVVSITTEYFSSVYVSRD